MRFGKKRSRTTAGRETQKQIPTSAPTQVIVPNQQDVDSPLHLEEKNVDSPQDNVSQVAGDPIQQLFTTLGKFHRHLNKAQHAPQGTGWCDECMNELMEGLEISIAHQWPPIKDALIDTARILHSYEEAGKAGTCVPFLKNSYELLSLMVGDLIVDTVRAGVKQKWQEHYLHAVEELKSQGITLIEDKKEDIALTPPAPDINLSAEMTPQPIPPNKTISVEIDMQQDTSKQIEPPAETSPKPVADLDNMSFDLPPLSDNFTNKNTDKKSEELGDIVPFPSKNEKTPFEDAPQNDDIHEKDLLKLDGLETLKKETETAEETDDSIKNKDNFDADSPIPEKPKQPAETQEKEKVIEEEIKEEGATDTLESPKNTTVLKDADASNLLKSDPADNEKKTVVTEETSSTTSPAAPMLEGASPEALLQRVQAAISSGDTRNTKAMALELAVAMAQLEYEQARKDLATAEQLLLENVRVIQQNSAKVTQMENDLLRTEELRGARDGEYNSCHQQIG
ncbi:MAG: hypothetical protein KAH38_09670, partial [Candidatus Hydrogenedentes bacterium]|nr:hypothetical protein [Candidatus Hydrogenedentota bacterium]